MPGTTLPALNRKLAPLNLELVRGDGYLYFIFDDQGPRYETHSVMVNSLNQLAPARWMEEAEAFLAKVAA